MKTVIPTLVSNNSSGYGNGTNYNTRSKADSDPSTSTSASTSYFACSTSSSTSNSGYRNDQNGGEVRLEHDVIAFLCYFSVFVVFCQ